MQEIREKGLSKAEIVTNAHLQIGAMMSKSQVNRHRMYCNLVFSMFVTLTHTSMQYI